MTTLFRLSGAVPRDPAVDDWFTPAQPLRMLVQPWFERLRAGGPDVRELIHDGRPTACLGDAAFAYVDAYTAHAAVGFFHGADLPDPAGLLEGSGARMRHVKLRWGRAFDEAALAALITAAHADIRARLDACE
jgi:hypothetical protein